MKKKISATDLYGFTQIKNISVAKKILCQNMKQIFVISSA